jgi:hypothetical protein
MKKMKNAREGCSPSSRARQRAEPLIEAELATLVPNEIERGERRLALGQPQTTAELLQENGGALDGAEEQKGINFGNVEAFVE